MITLVMSYSETLTCNPPKDGAVVPLQSEIEDILFVKVSLLALISMNCEKF